MKNSQYSLFLKERLGKIRVIRLIKILLQCTLVATKNPNFFKINNPLPKGVDQSYFHTESVLLHHVHAGHHFF